MMHLHSGNLSYRCNFSRSTTLLAAPSLPEVALTVVWSRNHRKSMILPVVDLFREFQVTQDDARPLWKSVIPMQLFTLYNFASSTALFQGGRHGPLGLTGLKIDGFLAARDSCGEIQIYSRKYGTFNREKSRLMPMSNDWCWYLLRRTNHRSRRSGLSL